jgi:hypothetical protein
MTGSASCRKPLRALGTLQLGNWAQGTSDRRGQDKARKVRALGRDGCDPKIPANLQTLRHIGRTLRRSGTFYGHSTFDTL